MFRRLSTPHGERNCPVIWVVVSFRAGYPEVSSRSESFSAIRGTGRFTEGDPQTQIHPMLKQEPGEVVVTKRQVGWSAAGLTAQAD
jgi:hypothetical protein